jgi:hypothetical protein
MRCPPTLQVPAINHHGIFLVRMNKEPAREVNRGIISFCAAPCTPQYRLAESAMCRSTHFLRFTAILMKIECQPSSWHFSARFRLYCLLLISIPMPPITTANSLRRWRCMWLADLAPKARIILLDQQIRKPKGFFFPM